jgi:hypothetical protein
MPPASAGFDGGGEAGRGARAGQAGRGGGEARRGGQAGRGGGEARRRREPGEARQEWKTEREVKRKLNSRNKRQKGAEEEG